jgi:hypothetical protein
MKKYNLLFVVVIIVLSSCSSNSKKKLDGATLSNEVCECKMKTKGMKYDDPTRVKMWEECLDLQGTNFKKVALDNDELEIYKKNNRDCMKKYTLGG